MRCPRLTWDSELKPAPSLAHGLDPMQFLMMAFHDAPSCWLAAEGLADHIPIAGNSAVGRALDPDALAPHEGAERIDVTRNQIFDTRRGPILTHVGV